ncbi:hypothetical protein EJ110_NYTH28723 [Nymphaea thermarum]|nr:hypothetical protein EJ110_NYTH28723 [Nymphaea thermarum]
MASRKNLAADAPWRAAPTGKPLPKIHQSPILRVSSDPKCSYGLAVMKHSNPVGNGFASEAQLESAGPECIVPGQVKPVRLLGLKVWPVSVSFKFLEPIGREMKAMGKFMDSAFNLMQASFSDR